VHVTAIIAAGGRGARLGGALPKQFLALGGRPILQRSVDAFVASDRIADLIVALPRELARSVPDYLRSGRKPVEIVEGGERRQDSVAKAFARVSSRSDVVVIHDAARPLVTPDLISRTVDAAARFGAAIAALPATDTVKRSNADRVIVDTIPRGEIFLAQTPQAFRIDVLRAALAQAREVGDATDEAMLAERAGHAVHLVDGDPRNLKITTAEDLATAERLLGLSAPGALQALRIGIGYDLHRLVTGRRLLLGGVTIPFDKGLDGHSDADVVCHAVTDAILGAAAAGDIGRHFPDTDAAWKDADSLVLLARAARMVADAGFAIGNVDLVIIAQRPKLVPHIDAMRANLARAMNTAVENVSIKGKTNEGVDSTGAGDSIAVHAVALLMGSGIIIRGQSK
jgi:2-C-methyl-D-erythritol 4-phosphate cytidylyltransferase/2-C-methyl-D-erythritol 2,4-cyclodiphosphate synthase